MSSTTYSVELAKSSRASCKKCKTKIEKDAMRIGTHTPRDDFDMTSWNHLECFTLPRKMVQQGVTAHDFVRDNLRDESGDILPSRADEIAEALEAKKAAVAKSKEDGDSESSAGKTWLADIKIRYDATQDDNPSASKKAKDDMSILVETYGAIHKLSIADLKEILQWNRQHVTGTKPVLMIRVLDGALRGRLARCTLCEGGRLKLHDDGATVTCSGAFDEERNVRVACQYHGKAESAPRWQPWLMQMPTKEEDEEMDRLIAEAKGEVPSASDSDPAIAGLIKQANKLDLELHNNEGIKKATAAIYKLLKSCSKLIDLPDDEGDAKHKVGAMVAANRSQPVADIVRSLVNELGFREAKDDKAAKKQAALKDSCKCPENLPVVSAFQALAEFYFKEGNRNGGVVHSKVATALQNLDFVVTPENAMSLGKGAKTKVANIGAKSAEKILEFVSTGQIEKLEEKRANEA
ncbi:hypothetical protein MPSEU_000788000 [Mayamaea pseudoterrestris]|nr:hypothetical protein MPSEU_000788000 [Mayamaea pseudoterrestris]